MSQTLFIKHPSENIPFPQDGTYRIRPWRIIDGDSLEIITDLGDDTWRLMNVRLAGIDTAEVAPRYGTPMERLEEKRFAAEAELTLSSWLEDTAPIGAWWTHTATFNPDKGKYGGYLAEIVSKDLASVNDWLVASDLAYPYYGGNKQSPWQTRFNAWKDGLE